MKQIKLEVGKTYRNRKGEEVRITGFAEGIQYPYRGNKGIWYKASGQWANAESPQDLIEEVTTSDASQKHNAMEVLILQVGKTYISRKGEEVKIIKKASWGPGQFKGSDGRWYRENGKRGYLSNEDSEDLIEEVEELPEPRYAFITPDDMKKVTAHRYTFKIPNGTKEVTVEQLGNRIVVEMVPRKGPKPGDVMVNGLGSVYIFKDVDGDGYHNYFVRLRRGQVAYNNVAIPGRLATPEEAKPLWDALKKAGKRWNAETMQVEDVPEFTRILEWVEENIMAGYYNHEDVAEAIEAYLKHREGTK